jgi:Ran GTPase-activating protein (RanGAP) involved in mRNA processing and transport
MDELESMSSDHFLLSLLAVCMEKANKMAECPRVPTSLIELYRVAIQKLVQKACPFLQDGAYSTIQQLAVYAQCKGLNAIGTLHIKEALCELTNRQEQAESMWGSSQRTIEQQSVPKTEHGTQLIDCWNKMIKTQVPKIPCFKIIEVGSPNAMCQPHHKSLQEFLAADLFTEFVSTRGRLPANYTGQSFKESNLFKWFESLETKAKVLNDSLNDHFLWLVSRFSPNSMAQEMFDCAHMSQLLMAECGLTDDGFSRLMYFINDRINSLDVSHNSLTEVTAGHIGPRLETDTFLHTLNLANNTLNTAGAEALATALLGMQKGAALTSLNLLKNEVGKAGAEALVEAFMANDRLHTLCGIGVLQKELDLRSQGLDFGDAILIAADIRKSKALLYVYLNKNELIGRVWQLKEQVNISVYDGLEALAIAMKDNKTVTHFDISRNQLGHIGSGIIATVLETNTTLQSFISCDNCLCGRYQYLDSSYGVYSAEGFRSLASAVKYNIASLTLLDVSQNFIGNDGVKALADALVFNIGIKSLILSRNNITSEQAGKSLSKMLEANSTLTELNLASGDITASAQNHAFVDELAVGIERCKLTVLDLSGIKPTVSLIDALVKLLTSRVPTLRELDISGNVIDLEHSQALAKAVRESVSLKKLTFCGALYKSEVWEPGDTLTVVTTAECIDCSNKVLGSSGSILLAAIVSKCAGLLTLQLPNTQWGHDLAGAKALAKGLISHEALSSITFGGEFCNSKPVTLQTNMTEADFSDKLLGAVGGVLLGGFLPKCKVLASLNVSNNTLIYGGDWEVDYSGIKAIAAALVRAPSLVNLNMSNNKAGSEGARWFYEAVTAGPSLQYLDMTGNGVSWSEQDGYGSKLKTLCHNKGIVLKAHESARELWKLAKGVGAGLSKKRLHRKRRESAMRRRDIQKAKEKEHHRQWRLEEGLLQLDSQEPLDSP